MAQSKVNNIVHEDANWRGRIKSENVTASKFQNEYGYLCETESPNKTAHATGTVKYYTGKGSYTVKQVKIPLTGLAAERAAEQEATMRSLASASGSRPSTALEATLFSHSKRLDYIEGPAERMMYEATSKDYGSRHTLEQFGVSDFGLKRLV